MYIRALSGFPGPYLADVEKQIKSEGYLKLLSEVTDRSAYWEYAIAYCEPGKEPVSFSTRYEGSIAYGVRGESGWYTDKVFVPAESTYTIAELLDRKEYVRDVGHYEQLKEYLLKQPNS
jgi:XTP/dITP diphosphohydrolase